ncbi:MAG TPA: DUF2098 domain-containing protein [Methanocorpusculum sp.]|nr:DUF2098 domain-containing protein [Methanocorpusculum sp.]
MVEYKIGQFVRYVNTGTVGKIIRLVEYNGSTFAELEGTKLLYRTDQLVNINNIDIKKTVITDIKKDIEEEQIKLREMKDSAWQNTDNSCEGGG